MSAVDIHWFIFLFWIGAFGVLQPRSGFFLITIFSALWWWFGITPFWVDHP
jgi:hypothetical protein